METFHDKVLTKESIIAFFYQIASESQMESIALSQKIDR